MSSGQVSKAMNRVTSHGIANAHDPYIQAQLQQKFPPASHPLPALVPKCAPVDRLPDLRPTLLSLQPGVSPGSGGLRNEYLVALGERLEDQEVTILGELGFAYLSGTLPDWFYMVWSSLQTVALYKTQLRTDVRPLGLKNSLIKLFHKEVMKQSKVEIREYLEPVQLGQSQAGAAKLVFGVRGLIQAKRDFICCKVDLANAFNEISRAAIIGNIVETQSISHLSSFASCILAPEVKLETMGVVWGKSSQGVAQGDPASGDLFCIGLHPSLLKLDEDCRAGNGMARAGHDDVCAIGPPEIVLPAVKKFAQEVEQRCGLRLQWEKTEVFSWEGDLPDGTPEGIHLAGENINGVFERGFECYGIPIGTDNYVRHKLRSKADEIVTDAFKTANLLRSDRQALWSALRLSISPRFEYFCQLAPPSLTEPIAKYLDEKLWIVLEAATGLSIPRHEDFLVNCPIIGLQNISYQEWLIRLPIRLHGWGLRSLQETCGPAFLGALETAIPFMHKNKICEAMEEFWGGEDYWGLNAPYETRWQKLIESGCKEGQELVYTWEKLKSRATMAAEWLGDGIDEIFLPDTPGVGLGSTDGRTRSRVVEAIEKDRFKLLSKSLELHQPQSTRIVWAWKQRDKISCAWLLSLPSLETQLTSVEFSEAAAANLCLPSPSCRDRVGEVIKGNVKVDLYGDNVQSTNIPGDHWRTRHDQMKLLIYRLCIWAGLPVEMEVFNLFSRCLPQEGLARVDSWRQRQAMVPDFRIALPSEGTNRQVLHELKIISCSKSRYVPSWTARAVDKRSANLNKEYLEKAKTADRQFGGIEVGRVGPVERKLISLGQVRGLVFGNFAECSEDMHVLIEAIASSRVRVAGPQRGRKGFIRSEEGEKSIVVGQLRRMISVAAVRAQCHSLLGRLEGLGTGGVAARGRRQEAIDLDRRFRKQRQAQWVSERQGWNILRKGFAKLD